jgi:anti-sigma regulatory factor (Ser/Thr protein kinase)
MRVRDLLGCDHPATYGVEFCTCELVTNSLIHTESKKVLVSVLRADDSHDGVDTDGHDGVEGGGDGGFGVIRVEVSDAATPDMVVTSTMPVQATTRYGSGRGLRIVDALMERHWGSRADESG